MSLGRKLAIVTVSIAGLVLLNYVFEYGVGDFQINPYYARIINLIGINITLAVSLNLINGLAGQFSIGHAGFMAVGGYTATYLTVFHGRQIAALVGSTPADPLGGSIVMIPSLLAGAAAAAFAGLLVGIPSLRLKGDYLAIVTLGFSEIIRVIILNNPAVGAPPDSQTPFPLRTSSGSSDGDSHGRHYAQHRDVDLWPRAVCDFAAMRLRPSDGYQHHPNQGDGVCRQRSAGGGGGGLSGQLFANPLNPAEP